MSGLGQQANGLFSLNSGAARMKQGRAFEDHVLDVINREQGWRAERFADAALSDQMRKAVEKRDTLIRWLPDIVATYRGRGLVFFDPKSGRTDTDNWDVEIRSVDACQTHEEAWGFPVFFVFSDLSTASAREILDSNPRRGPPSPNGSGTPYYLTPKSLHARKLSRLLFELGPLAGIEPDICERLAALPDQDKNTLIEFLKRFLGDAA